MEGRYNLLNIEEIEELIPHRKPFLLLDEVEIVSKSKVIGYKYYDGNEFYLAGHFPENPIVPGVILLESAAQTSAILTNMNKGSVYENKEGVLVKISNFTFKKIVRPNEKIRNVVELIRNFKEIYIYKCKIYCNQDMIANGEITATLLTREE